MQIGHLDHVNLRTAQLDTMVAWYAQVLGLHAGPRPDFPFGGAWLYAGDRAAVHLIAVDDPAGAGSEQPLKLEHFAFTATGAQTFADRLAALGVPVRRTESDLTGTIAFNINDPDGNHIHVDFPRDE